MRPDTDTAGRLRPATAAFSHGNSKAEGFPPPPEYCSAAAAAVVVVLAAAAAVAETHAVATAAAEQQDQDDDPPATAKAIITIHTQEPPVKDMSTELIPCYDRGPKW